MSSKEIESMKEKERLMTNREKTLETCENYLCRDINNVVKVYNKKKNSDNSRFVYIYEEEV